MSRSGVILAAVVVALSLALYAFTAVFGGGRVHPLALVAVIAAGALAAHYVVRR